ncbi:OLC1v1000302C1 [Oldenlandia corymbosa var. corymbosa]|uniref:RING-type E3 ubiquitin transferase n=1 Tax=Oldenlandia corymbosa var. corymbosa TaxID=529605 RepID=A0AAV1D2L6_OLDCO|nr:OLC1v1000302C1 [Oldenlandia corymbosa var. corymbosa]
MSFFDPRPPPTSPPINGGSVPTPTTLIISQPQYSSRSTPTDILSDSTSSSPPTSPSTSIIIVIIVIASAIVVSATIYLLLRLLSRRCRSTFRTFSSTSSVAEDVVLPNHLRVSGRAEDRRSLNQTVLESLPLFTFGSIKGGNFTSGDCAVCLSKFERQDQLRLLPLCCHAFHADCIGAWLSSNLTCPLCRSTVTPTDRDIIHKILGPDNPESNNNGNINGGNNSMSRSGSFRVEIGSVSRRREAGDDDRRTYSVGTFDYIVDDACEVPIGSIHQRGVSDCTSVDKDSVNNIPVTGPPGENVAMDVGGSRSWLREYVDRISSLSFSSRTMSFRSSGRFFAGSSRRSEVVVPIDDLEAGRQGEEISEFFRWLSPV